MPLGTKPDFLEKRLLGKFVNEAFNVFEVFLEGGAALLCQRQSCMRFSIQIFLDYSDVSRVFKFAQMGRQVPWGHLGLVLKKKEIGAFNNIEVRHYG